MITSILQGGLGNQLFQIATTFSLSQELKTSYSFDFEKCMTMNQGFSSIKYADTFYKKIKIR